jgi:hypothetical protein
MDWDQIGTLSNSVGGYDIRTDPIWILVITAKQGHEGPMEAMRIRTSNGVTYSANEIEALAQRPDRRFD